jgi:hypothetical protein
MTRLRANVYCGPGDIADRISSIGSRDVDHGREMVVAMGEDEAFDPSGA